VQSTHYEPSIAYLRSPLASSHGQQYGEPEKRSVGRILRHDSVEVRDHGQFVDYEFTNPAIGFLKDGKVAQRVKSLRSLF